MAAESPAVSNGQLQAEQQVSCPEKHAGQMSLCPTWLSTPPPPQGLLKCRGMTAARTLHNSMPLKGVGLEPSCGKAVGLPGCGHSQELGSARIWKPGGALRPPPLDSCGFCPGSGSPVTGRELCWFSGRRERSVVLKVRVLSGSWMGFLVLWGFFVFCF